MEAKTRKALLDTDFIFKTQLAQNHNREALADLIIGFEEYEFYCHEKIIDELSYHGFKPDPIPWLTKKIDEGLMKCYSDGDIMGEIESELGMGAQKYFFDMLKNSCDSFDSEFFNCFYKQLIKLPDRVGKQAFLDALRSCEHAIGNGNSMGEKKTFVLAQMLQLRYPGQVVVFCSDDSKARQNIAYVDGSIRCLSILAAFQKLKVDGLEKSTAREYYDSLCGFYTLHGQKAMKVWKHGTSERIRVDFEQLFEEMYADRFEIRGNGDLRYKD